MRGILLESNRGINVVSGGDQSPLLALIEGKNITIN